VSVPYLVAFLAGAWRRFNGGFELTVAEAPDGLRVRSGLVERTAETIPTGRVQAVRLSQPLTWRPFGWCRLEVDVAGRQRKRRENSAQAGQMRAVLPVGSMSEARWLLSRIIPAAPQPDRPAPGRARVKAPLSYHWLSWGGDDRCLVTVGGRVRKVTHWVPLAKVQSIRVTEGPVQRRFDLASIHVDTAGRSMHAVLRDRSADEVTRVLPWLIDQARQVRLAARPVPPS
jgi:putative membrane protein